MVAGGGSQTRLRQMAERDRDGVGRVRLRRNVLQLVEPLEGVADLRLLSGAVTGDRELHLERTVFLDGDTGLRGGEQHDPGGAGDVQRALLVLVPRDALDG